MPLSSATSVYPSLARLLRDRAGTTALTFAVLAIPICAAVGFGIDYGNAMRVRVNLQDAIDAATLSAARDFDTKSDGELSAMVTKLVQAAAFDEKDLQAFKVTVDRTNRTISAEGTVRVGTTVAGLMGQEYIDVAARTTSIGASMEYVNIYLLLDRSASMGLAANEAAAAAMVKGVGCRFGCHDKEGGQTISNMQYALNNGIKLRIDTEHEGVAEILRVVKSVDPTATYVRMGISYFDEALDNTVKPTTDRRKIEAATTDYGLGNGTFFSSVMDSFTTYVGKSGSGKTASDPRKVVLMVTDGAQSSRPWVLNAPDRWRVSAFDAKQCERLKDNGVTVAVLDAIYLPIEGDWGYDATLGQPSSSLPGKDRRDEIEPNLRTCASDTYYLSAADDAGMRTGMASLLSRYLKTVRLAR